MPNIGSNLLILAQMTDDGHMDWDDGWGIVMLIGMLLFLALVTVGIVWIVRELGTHRQVGRDSAADDPLAILDRRLAEGTISPEDYRERRTMLGEPADQP